MQFKYTYMFKETKIDEQKYAIQYSLIFFSQTDTFTVSSTCNIHLMITVCQVEIFAVV